MQQSFAFPTEKLFHSFPSYFQMRELVKQQSFPCSHEKIISLFLAFFLGKAVVLYKKKPNNRHWHDVCYLSIHVIVRLRFL
jgi:hypothetical protein